MHIGAQSINKFEENNNNNNIFYIFIMEIIMFHNVSKTHGKEVTTQ